ncbi:MAG: hypothetical protein HY719_05835 [Planctomycetes bacterium]|nr:hypothetical protein [Planctomycetota bacterium]
MSIRSLSRPRPVIAAALALLALLFLPRVARAQTEEMLHRRDGTVVKGVLVALEEDGRKVRYQENGQEGIAALDDLLPESAYRARRHFIDPASGAAHYDLGLFCLEKSLFYLARKEFTEAARLDPALAPRVEARTRELEELAAAEKLDLARKRVAEKSEEAARVILRSLLKSAPESVAAKEAQALLAQLEGQAAPAGAAGAAGGVPAPIPGPGGGANPAKAGAEAGGAAAAAPDDKAKEGARKPLDKKAQKKADILKDIGQKAERDLLAGRQAYYEGLDNDGDGAFTRAQQAYDKAEALYARAREGFSGLVTESDADDEKKAADERVAEIDDRLVRLYLARGHLEAAQLNLSAAARYANKALRIDEENRWALMLRQKVTEQRMERGIRGRTSPEPTKTPGATGG